MYICLVHFSKYLGTFLSRVCFALYRRTSGSFVSALSAFSSFALLRFRRFRRFRLFRRLRRFRLFRLFRRFRRLLAVFLVFGACVCGHLWRSPCWWPFSAFLTLLAVAAPSALVNFNLRFGFGPTRFMFAQGL